MKNQKRSIEEDNKNIERRKKHVDKLMGRFKPKGQANVPKDILSHIQRQFDIAILQNGEKIAVLDRVAELLEDYEFEKDAPDYTPKQKMALDYLAGTYGNTTT